MSELTKEQLDYWVHREREAQIKQLRCEIEQHQAMVDVKTAELEELLRKRRG